MNKIHVYTVEFAAQITVPAYSQKDAVQRAARILDNPTFYPTYVHFAYVDALDVESLDSPEKETAPIKDEEVPF